METRIVGVDCAVSSKNVGLALALWDGERCQVERVARGDAIGPGREEVARWLAREVEKDARTLFALDAPLGWPRPLGDALARHAAGEPIAAEPERLFRRDTDRDVASRLGKHPLEVGADRIARTAVATLELLGHLRSYLGAPVEVAVSATSASAHRAIEVYPAGTLKALGLRHEGYKKPSQRSEREAILEGLASLVTVSVDPEPLVADANLLDAVVAVVAGRDFLEGRARGPHDAEIAWKEGWIWVRDGHLP